MALAIAGFIACTGVHVLRQNLRYAADAAAPALEAVHAVVVPVAGVASAPKIEQRFKMPPKANSGASATPEAKK